MIQINGHEELQMLDSALRAECVSHNDRSAYLSILEQLQVSRFENDIDPQPFHTVDRTHQRRPEHAAFAGHVPECSTAGCGYLCCDVGVSGANTITLYPGELEQSEDSTNHLTIVATDPEAGSCRATCNLMQDGCGCGRRATGSLGMKPLDCSDYPWLRSLNRGVPEFWVSDDKCPMPAVAKLRHLVFVADDFFTQLRGRPVLIPHYEGAHAEMVGYKRFDPGALEDLTANQLEQLLRIGLQCELKKERERITRQATHTHSGADESEYESTLKDHTEQAVQILRETNGIRFSHVRFHVPETTETGRQPGMVAR